MAWHYNVYNGFVGTQAAKNTLMIGMMPKVTEISKDCVFVRFTLCVPDGDRVRWGYSASPSPICFRHIYSPFSFSVRRWCNDHSCHIQDSVLNGNSVQKYGLPHCNIRM